MSTAVSKIVCPSCRAEHEPDTNFCGRCGSDLRMRVSAVRRAISEVPAGDPPEGIDPLIGRLIDSRYRVLSRLGQGGMGIVYKVEHQRMGKIAAMKVLHRELAADKEVVKRFRREAEAVSKLTHQNTVQTFDFGTADGAMYLVMEYVRGEDLGTILKRDGPIPFRRAAPIFEQICGALAEAHELGIVHRDLKPENILVTRSKDGHDRVKVLDFGLAKLSEREEAAEVTGRGTIIGTPYYMSPEQIRGELLDHRSDIYSMGAMMYRILCGEHPFHAQTPVGVLTKHLTDDVVPMRERRADLVIDERVDAIVLRAMEKKRDTRYPSVDALRADLERVLEEIKTGSSGRLEAVALASSSGSGPVRARSEPGAPGRERRKADDHSGVEPRMNREDFDAFERSLRRRGVVRMLLVPLVLAIAGGGLVWYLRWQKRQPRTEEREPNNTLERATLIAPGATVHGKIGTRLDDTQSDRDYYRVRVPGGRPMRLAASLSAIKRMDLAIAIYDRTGKLLVTADNGLEGEPEVVPNQAVDVDEVYVAVMESRFVTDGPTENPTDEYGLIVRFEQAGPTDELEPNDLDSDATPLAPDRPVRAFAGKYRDVDRFRLDGAAGRYEIELTVEGGVPLQVRISDGDARDERKLQVDAARGTIISVERRDPDPAAGQRPSASGVDRPYTIVARPVK